jgi:aminopeptidase N
MRFPVLVISLAAACGGGGDPTFDAPPNVIPPTEDSNRDVVATDLAIDLTALTGVATITLAPSTSMGATFEIGDIEVTSVTRAGGPLEFADRGDRLDVGVPATTEPLVLEIHYNFMFHTGFMGAAMQGWTLLWPYYCGNLFPCRSNPSDGTTFTLALAGVDPNMTAVYPASIPTEAPSYQLAWAIGDYDVLDLGTTTAGTHVQAWHRPNELTAITNGTVNLRDAFDWFETTLGPYLFGTEVGTVGVSWGPGALGGMEHHPMWHIASGALSSEEVNVHEAAHGWFGDGIRIACWEDFVLSEGTVTYLAGRALDVVAPAAGAAVWVDYEDQLGNIPPTDPVWPDSCNVLDVLEDNLFTNAPYIRGAFFYRAVALSVGADNLDAALGAFYMQYGGRAARMSDMLRVIQEETGFDPTACADAWLRSTTIPAVGPCP